MDKFKLTSETKVYLDVTLHRIKALRDFASIKAGERGGWVEKKRNLNQNGNAWVSGNAQVSDGAWVFDGDPVHRIERLIWGELTHGV